MHFKFFSKVVFTLNLKVEICNHCLSVGALFCVSDPQIMNYSSAYSIYFIILLSCTDCQHKHSPLSEFKTLCKRISFKYVFIYNTQLQ